MKVLVAHGSEQLRSEAWDVLDRLGWDVFEADSAHDAARVCRVELPDVALIEGALAWPQGGSLINHFKSDPQLRQVVIVVVEPERDFEAGFAGLKAGADEYLLEPYSPYELAVRIEAAGRMSALKAKLADQSSELRTVVHTDALTGLFNRRYMTRQISAQINNAGRHRFPLSLLLVDIDSFKAINDTLGHAEGDRALGLVAGALTRRLRDIDIAGRWGGDEFVVLLPSTSGKDAVVVAEGLTTAVNELDYDPRLTLSIGCAEWTNEDAPGLVARADDALYEVKRAGRDGVAVAPEPVLAIEVTTPPTAASANKPLRVVLVDDVEGIRGLMRVTLEGSAIQIVGEAQDGEEAVMVVRQTQPDVVVMDWNMPGMDGIQGTRALREEYPQAMVVACTSSDEPRIQLAMRKAGAVAHFSKSDLSDLAAFLGDLQSSGRLAS